MGKTVVYQGYTIHSTPHYETAWEKWRLRTVVSAEDSPHVRTREFSSEILHATKQEANIHGIAFGQRLIDGKLIGRSVADMKTTDRRVTPRLRVQFRPTFSDFRRLEGSAPCLICLWVGAVLKAQSLWSWVCRRSCGSMCQTSDGR